MKWKGWGKEMLCYTLAGKLCVSCEQMNMGLRTGSWLFQHIIFLTGNIILEEKSNISTFGAPTALTFYIILGLEITRRHVITLEEGHLKIRWIDIYYIHVFSSTLTSTYHHHHFLGITYLFLSLQAASESNSFLHNLCPMQNTPPPLLPPPPLPSHVWLSQR